MDADLASMATVAETGGAFNWLANEPDLYTDADLVKPRTGSAPVPHRAL